MAKPNKLPILVIGHVSRRVGLGVTARSIARALLDRCFEVKVFDVSPGGAEAELESLCLREDELPRGAITISVLGLDEIVDHISQRPWLFFGQALNVGFFWWELTHIPAAWATALRLFDAHLAGSRFLEKILQRAVERTPVVWAPHPLFFSGDVRPCRERFGISEESTVFLTAFDPASEPARKNPLAAVDAFQLAVGNRKDAILIVRANTSVARRRAPIVRQVADRAKTDRRIRLFESSLPYQEVMQLIASCDVLISLHRAEGLGLPLLEAMALGKPVVATNWSGNLDFMSKENSCLVDYSLTKVEAHRWTYRLPSVRRYGQWAEPSVHDAARSIRLLLDSADARAQIGRRAAKDAKKYLQTAEQASFAARLLELAQANGGRTALVKGLNEREIRRLRQLEQWQRLDWGALAYTRLRDLYDRHLGWRFRGR